MSGSVSTKDSSWIFNGDALTWLANVKLSKETLPVQGPLKYCLFPAWMSNIESSPWAMVYSQNRCLLPCYIRAFQHGDSINPVYEISGLQWLYTCAYFTTIPDARVYGSPGHQVALARLLHLVVTSNLPWVTMESGVFLLSKIVLIL